MMHYHIFKMPLKSAKISSVKIISLQPKAFMIWLNFFKLKAIILMHLPVYQNRSMHTDYASEMNIKKQKIFKKK